MSNSHLSGFSSMGVERKRLVKTKRLRVLAGVIRLCESGKRRQAIGFLLGECAKDSDVWGVRMVDVIRALYGCGRDRALSDLTHAAALCDGFPRRVSLLTVGDCMRRREDSYRMVAILWVLCVRHEHARLTVPDGFPFGLLYGGE